MEEARLILILFMGTWALISALVWHFEYKRRRKSLEYKLKISLLENELRHLKHILRNL